MTQTSVLPHVSAAGRMEGSEKGPPPEAPFNRTSKKVRTHPAIDSVPIRMLLGGVNFLTRRSRALKQAGLSFKNRA